MRITLIVGADAAPFARGLAAGLTPDETLTVIAPVVRDRWLTGLKSCPDLDGLLGVGDAPPTHGVADELVHLGYSRSTQRRTDADIAVQLIRTELLGAGYSLTEATAATARRRSLGFALLPSSDDRAELNVVVVGADGPHAIHVEELLEAPGDHDVQDVVLVAEAWSVSSAARADLEATDLVVLGPSSRTLAIDPVLRTPGLLDLIDPSTPVLVVQHRDEAPPALIRAAGLSEPDPGSPETVPAEVAAVLARARQLAAS
ncbi:2-phospho-L-lactate transferase CofD family protein [Aeromicrobium sp.]|uniref:2-phospho-L-lactate transferase CofD family protein n=1 Tax=Aeromicrobium sp. TaxID=1871063 RepID=UPI0019A4D8C9|nr:2-phospho-L-lactate transferase CofD family protein [Aeromicrobium sp.]MBC7632017.1 YvcK family protein [Aeromicrobium sp.]